MWYSRLEKATAEIVARERDQLRRDLHDGVCQQFRGLGFLAKKLGLDLARASRSEAVQAGEICAIADETANMAHDIAAGLMPVFSQPYALGMALNELAARVCRMSAVRCRVAGLYSVDIVDRDVSNQLFLIAQEAVTNAVKHAECSEVEVRLSWQGSKVVLNVSDNGKGFMMKPDDATGMGLHIMQSRARLIGANLDVVSSAKSGTVVKCTWTRSAGDPCEGAV